ncbi:MAG: hypothetical protein P1P85_05480 [Patescibacteria group bacterium]|nr:hypothetical protein [Patescibacteria group bacterium]
MKINKYWEPKQKRRIYRTKKRILAEQRKQAKFIISFTILCVLIGMFLEAKNSFVINNSVVSSHEVAHDIVIPQREGEETPLPTEVVTAGTLREVTAYNAGDPSQTDSTPCIGAMGTNICKKLAEGKKICAANFVKLGTVLNIKGYGDCVVEDRMNSRFKNRVDIAMEAHEKSRAIAFGLQNLSITIKK